MTAFSYKVLMAQSESVTGREARGLQTEETGYKSQTFFYFSLKLQEETNCKCQIFFLLCTKLKGGFS